MRDSSVNGVKAWAKEYDEAPFYFIHEFKHGKRLIAWSEEAEQIKRAFYGILELFPTSVEVLVKILAGKVGDDETKWSRFHGIADQWKFIRIVQENEAFVFSNGLHQLCIKDPDSEHYLAFGDHSIFFIYSPTDKDIDLFHSLGFEPRRAEPIYSVPHFQSSPPDSEILEAKFVGDLKLEKANSDLD
jgi:hypothetical protein